MYRILVVDDEEMIRRLIVKYAAFEGHTVDCRFRYAVERGGKNMGKRVLLRSCGTGWVGGKWE